ncbi:MAG TPA: outer membrane protein assembly factor BamD [Planctomycetes bacterium]|nr:outer membrane protein assembly factor BamD [Planctomycetota bacterium]HIK81575.1 outer membrane protein assembly factor BamD [Planctomycetota bacterium]
MTTTLALFLLVAAIQEGDPLPEMLIQARNALEQGQYPEAVTLYEDAIELAMYGEDDGPVSGPLLARIRLGLAEAYRASRQNDDALRATEGIFDSDPGPETLDRALEIRYEIGLSYLNGTTRRLLGLEISAERKGLQILGDLIQRYPFQPFSDDAVFHSANWYLKNKLPEDAERFFERLLREYPESPWAAPAQILAGDAVLAQIKGVEYDMGPLAVAERHYRRYLRLFPNQGESQRARMELAKISKMRAQRHLLVAQFYLGIDKPESARVYLEKVLLDVPASEEAVEARRVLATLVPQPVEGDR